MLEEVHTLVTGNRIFMDRMVGVGALSRRGDDRVGDHRAAAARGGRAVRRAPDAAATGRTTGSSSRSPLGKNGDNFDRYLVRMAEMEQSMRIAEQALDGLPGGAIQVDFEGKAIDPAAYVDQGKQGKTEGLLLLPITLSPNLQGQDRGAHERVNAADKRVVLPTKETAYGSIEGLMNHFMLVMEGYGIRPPPGEAYFAAEGANGELGFYVVSDGTDRPYRVRCRPPCLPRSPRSRHDRGRDGRRPHPHLRLRQHDRRGARSITAIKDANKKTRKLLQRARLAVPAQKIERVAYLPISLPGTARMPDPASRVHAEQLAEVRRLQALYPDKQGALLPVLHLAQEIFGYVSLEVEEYVAGLFELSPAHVHEVVTFYTLFFQQPTGRHVVAVCHNLSCHLASAPSASSST